MRKMFFYLACCLLLTLPTQMFADGNEIEIQLVEVIPSGSLGGGNLGGGDSPLDSPGETGGTSTDPNQFHATIAGSLLSVTADNPFMTDVRVFNTMGGLVLNRQFVGFTTEQISNAGNYVLHIQSGNLTLVGQFYAQ